MDRMDPEPDEVAGDADANRSAGVVNATEFIIDLTELLRGLATIAVRAIWSAISPDPADVPDDADVGAPEPGVLSLIPGAAVALMVEAERRALQAAAMIDEQVGPVVQRVMGLRMIQAPAEAARRTLENLSTRGVKEQQHAVAAAQSLVERAVPEVVRAVLDIIDVDEIIARVDIDGVVERVDLNRAVSRVDVEEIIARVDIDGVVRRVDIDAIVKRLDLASLTDEVITEVDLREIVRESSSSITGEAVDAVRVQGMNADRFVSRLMDKVLFRRAGRDLDGPAPVPDGPAAAVDDTESMDADAGRGPVPTS
ncbi:MAG TPA: hypothetical protein VID47_19085 [Actinomycetota bacterium]|jgi:hypothetical protein